MRNTAWYLLQGILDSDAATQVQEDLERCIRSLVPQIPALLSAFEIPENQIRTPIAENWVEFNEHNNEGEVL